jgi:cell division protease FtsH
MLLDKEVVDRHDLDMILAGNVTPMPPPKAEAGSPASVPALVPAQQPHSR